MSEEKMEQTPSLGGVNLTFSAAYMPLMEIKRRTSEMEKSRLYYKIVIVCVLVFYMQLVRMFLEFLFSVATLQV